MNVQNWHLNIGADFVTVLAIGKWMVALLSLILTVTAWPFRKQRAGMVLINMLFSTSIWNIFSGLANLSDSMDSKVYWIRFAYFGVCAIPSYTFLLGRMFNLNAPRLSTGFKLILGGIPFITVLMVFTNPMHGWMWRELSLADTGAGVYVGGWWFWVWIAFSYTLLTSALVQFIRAARKSQGTYRKQAFIMSIAMIPPGLFNVLHVLRLDLRALHGYDVAPLAFGITILILAANYRMFYFLKSMPVARDQIMENMNQAMLVLDTKLRILDVNQAISVYSSLNRENLLDKGLYEVFPQFAQQFDLIRETHGERHGEVYFEGVGYLDVHVSPLPRRESLLPGWIVLLYDLSPRQKAQQQLREAHWELQRKAAELEEAQETIKSIGDLIPICAWCGRRIELEDGTWIDVDRFIEEHSHAELAHGICPECARKAVPE